MRHLHKQKILSLVGIGISLLFAIARVDVYAENNAVEVAASDTRIYLGYHSKVYIDSDSSLSIHDIIANGSTIGFESPSDPSLQFGYSDDSIWVAVHISNPSVETVRNYLEVRYAPLDDIHVYLVNLNGEILQQSKMGDHHSYSSRPIDSRSTPLSPPRQQTSQVLPRPDDRYPALDDETLPCHRSPGIEGG